MSKTAPRSGRAKWYVLLVLVLAAFIAAKTGWMGFGWAQLMSRVFPRDHALLGWVPGETTIVAIVDPHQIDLAALGAEGGPARTWLERARRDIREATDIDLVFDVDKLVLTPSLLVARGRFDREELTERLTALKYQPAEHSGRAYLVRQGEDAIAVVDEDVLLYGDQASVTLAIDAHEKETSLRKNDKTLDRLAQVGWDQALLALVVLNDDHPSLRARITGATGPRAVMLGARTAGGLDARVVVESATPAAADELAKLLDEKRANVEATLGAILGPEAGKLAADIAKDTRVRADAANATVILETRVPTAALEAAFTAVGKVIPTVEAWKTLRLAQLLSP